MALQRYRLVYAGAAAKTRCGGTGRDSTAMEYLAGKFRQFGGVGNGSSIMQFVCRRNTTF
jgi:hypothetical protein